MMKFSNREGEAASRAGCRETFCAKTSFILYCKPCHDIGIQDSWLEDIPRISSLCNNIENILMVEN